MSNCLKCVYPKGEPKGSRACKKCQRPENMTKGEWLAQLKAAATTGIEDLLGLPEEPAYGRSPGVEALPVIKALEALPIEERAKVAAEFVRSRLLEEPTPIPPPSALSNTAALSVTSEGAGGAANADTPSADALPAHSPLGGSGAKRWMNCSGSTALIQRLKLVEDETEFSAYGTKGHTMAARCLDDERDAWEIVHEYEGFEPRDAEYVQQYVNYVRSRPGRRRVEIQHHRPELHPLMFGQVDAELVPVTGVHDLVLEIVDLKFGEGVYVDAEHNEQMLYYATMVIHEDPTFFPDEGRVRLTIAQPRMLWADPIRSWETTVGYIKQWTRDHLLPAMHREEAEFALGDWCQFCPAKLLCPLMRSTLNEAEAEVQAKPAEAMSDEELGVIYEKLERLQTYRKAIGAEVHKRLMDRRTVANAKLVAQKVDRVFKEKVERVDPETGEVLSVALQDAATAKFGDDAYTPPKLLSPAQMEALPGGKDFVAEWAYKPVAGYAVALASDKRAAVVPKSGGELFASVAQRYLDAAE